MRNKLIKFGANSTTFEPPITGLKMTNSEPTNLDRFFSFFLSSHIVMSVFYFSLSVSTATSQSERRLGFAFYPFHKAISTVNLATKSTYTKTELLGCCARLKLYPSYGGI